MARESTPAPRHDTAGTMMAAVFILIGAVAWWDTTTMSDADSYVFPRAVIVAMVAFCLLLILFNLLRPRVPAGAEITAGSVPRRVLLVVLMIGGAAAMPLFGFLLSGLVVFGLLVLVAMYDTWTRFRLLVYPLTGAAIVAGFYLLFAELLLVPLPVGSLFE